VAAGVAVAREAAVVAAVAPVAVAVVVAPGVAAAPAAEVRCNVARRVSTNRAVDPPCFVL